MANAGAGTTGSQFVLVVSDTGAQNLGATPPYKYSSLGFMWSLVRPLTQLAIYYVVLGQFLGAARGIPDFAIYVFTGLTAYTLFSEMVLGGAGSIVNRLWPARTLLPSV